jgi:myo-inositol catabolism protein IolC
MDVRDSSHVGTIADVTDRLHVLAFDHRRSLITSFFGVAGQPSEEDVERARLAKRLIWRGFLRARDEGVGRGSAAVLIDVTYGDQVLGEARTAGIRFAIPVEDSGREEFGFESPRWPDLLDEIEPTWAKALVRYDPEGDPAVNARQRAALRELCDHCRKTERAFMLELLVPPSPSRLDAVDGDRGRFDREVRADLTVRGIAEIQEAGVEPNLWKLEGFEQPADYERVVAAARSGGRDQVGCIVLGRGEDAAAVERWLRAGAGVNGVVGWAIGRTIWWDPLRAFFAGADADEVGAVTRIAANYRHFVDVDGSATHRA